MNHKMLKLLTGFSALAVAGLLSLVPASVSRADEYEPPAPTLTPTPTSTPLPDGYDYRLGESTSVTVNVTDNISNSSDSIDDVTLNWVFFDIIAFDSVSIDSVDFIIYDQQLQNISINATLNATNYWETSAYISLSFPYGDYIYSIDKWADINWASDTTATISFSDTGFFSNYTYEPPTPPSIAPSPSTSTFTTNRIKVICNGSEEECEANITWTFFGVVNDITVAYAVPTFTIYPASQSFDFFGYFGTDTDYDNTSSAGGSVEFDFTYNGDEYHGSNDFYDVSPTGYGYYYVRESTTGDFYVAPSASPSVSPSPSEDPEIPASASPSTVPSEVPASPSGVPASPSGVPASPSGVPASPSGVPASASPSASVEPSAQPSSSPSVVPSTTPSASPSTEPSAAPSATPSVAPSASPSVVPSTTPSATPSATPSTEPSTKPSEVPSATPSATPSTEPSNEPSATPSVEPSTTPSEEPSLPPEDDDDPAVKEFYENINNTVNEIENAISDINTVIDENGKEVIEPKVIEYKCNTAISARIISAMTKAKNVTLLYTFEYDGIIFRAVITPEQAALIFNEKTKWYGPCYIAENFPTVPIGFAE